MATAVYALGPHECLLLVNQNSTRSKEVANHFASLRKIPDLNVVYVDVPDAALACPSEISVDDFNRYIREPAEKAIRDRGLDHILAWVYSVDFPSRVRTSPGMSLQGITFTRGVVPEKEQIDRAMFASPLFAGPDSANGTRKRSLSLIRQRRQISEFPVPSMSLGYLGSRGTDLSTVLKTITNGVMADASGPNGTVFFLLNDDIRTKCRAWEFAPTAQELAVAHHVRSVISSNAPAMRGDILGIQMGTPAVNPRFYGTFRPGAMAEHLTSHAATFEESSHTKLTEWLRLGATASAGTVVEPYAIWAKFPHSRFFVHYAAGCTMLESFFQAVRCPLQLYIVGEPLARPRTFRLGATVRKLAAEQPSDPLRFEGGVTNWLPQLQSAAPEYAFFLDGRMVQAPTNQAQLEINPSTLADGWHTLRVVARTPTEIIHEDCAETNFFVRQRGRLVEVGGIRPGAKIRQDRPFQVRVRASGKPDEIGLWGRGQHVVARSTTIADSTFTVDPAQLGAGPCVLQAYARYGNEFAYGIRIAFELADLNRPPQITRVDRVWSGADDVHLKAVVSDPDGDPLQVQWFQPVLAAITNDSGSPTDLTPSGGRVELTAGNLLFKPDSSNQFDVVAFPLKITKATREYRCDLTVAPGPKGGVTSEIGGLVFGYEDPSTFAFFGIMGDHSAWTFGRVRNGKIERKIIRGAWVQKGRSYRLAVRLSDKGEVDGLVNGEVVARWKEGAEHWTGSTGLLVGKKPALFENLSLSPPAGPDGAFSAAENQLIVKGSAASRTKELIVRVSDGASEAEQSVSLNVLRR